MFRDAALVAGKDLRIELRSQVTTQQIAPFAILVLILFGVALDPDRGILDRASSGPLLGGGALLQPAGHPAGVHHRGGRRWARRAPPLRARSRRDLPGQGDGDLRPARSPSRRSSRSAWCSLRHRRPWRGRCSSPPAGPRPRGWRRLARCTACSPPVSASERRCSRSCCCRCSRRCSSAPRRRSRPRWGAWPPTAGRGAACSSPSRALHGLRHPRLRHPLGGVMTVPFPDQARRVPGAPSLARRSPPPPARRPRRPHARGAGAAARLRARVEPRRPRDARQRPPHVRARSDGHRRLRRLRHHHDRLGHVAAPSQRGLVGAGRSGGGGRHRVHRSGPGHRAPSGADPPGAPTGSGIRGSRPPRCC